ncbi:trypsin-like peptidase domain-containing protein [Candidatus Dependentiae bacterium]|nr:trypsin-like peptidase domain-containing protein [Candidatus Dependentiae bacterium]
MKKFFHIINVLVFFTAAINVNTSQLYAKTKNKWLEIQQKGHNAVVQIFCHNVITDLIIPFRMPEEKSSCSSGFFIKQNNNFFIVTNAHAVGTQKEVYFCLPAAGNRPFKAYVLSIAPERDLALLKPIKKFNHYMQEYFGSIHYLELADSDMVAITDEVLALGYPLGQQGIKGTKGVVSGWHQGLIQTDAPINPGNSGCPLLSRDGKVIGITCSGIPQAQNVGYFIPVNELKLILPALHEHALVKKPFLGILSINATDAMTDFLGNPRPGGCYVVEVIKDSPLYKAGVQSGDMIYEIDGHKLDIYGDMQVDWFFDKVSLIDYVARLAIGQTVNLVLYRNGERKELEVDFDYSQDLPIRHIYPGYDKIDYRVFGGMVIMPLSLNHVAIFEKHAPGLQRYCKLKNQVEPRLIITHIFSNTALHLSRTIAPGVVINKINDKQVKTLEDFDQALSDSITSGYLTLNVVDTITKASDSIPVVLLFEELLKEEITLLQTYHYPLLESTKQLFEKAGYADALNH